MKLAEYGITPPTSTLCPYHNYVDDTNTCVPCPAGTMCNIDAGTCFRGVFDGASSFLICRHHFFSNPLCETFQNA